MYHTLYFFFFPDFYAILSLGVIFQSRASALVDLCLFSLGFFRCFLLGTCSCFVLGFS